MILYIIYMDRKKDVLPEFKLQDVPNGTITVENKKRESKQREEGENAERREKETERRGREDRD